MMHSALDLSAAALLVLMRAGLAVMGGHVTKHGAQHPCPSCGTVLDGAPVLFWCAACRRRRVHAADLDVEYQAPGSRGRAV